MRVQHKMRVALGVQGVDTEGVLLAWYVLRPVGSLSMGVGNADHTFVPEGVGVW